MNFASWGARVGAYLVDYLTVLPIHLIAYFVAGPKADPATGTVTPAGPLYYGLLLLATIVWGYNRWYQAGKTGQSWGRKALGISLLSESTGRPIGAGMAFLRDLAHIIDSIPCLIGFLFPLWDSKRQTIADKLVKTVVTTG